MDQKGEINIQSEKNEETRIQLNEERLRNLQDIFKCSNIWIIGVPDGEEEEEKIENWTYIQDYCIQQSYHLEWKGR